jgi:cyclic pyranopterin phosphate synthase
MASRIIPIESSHRVIPLSGAIRKDGAHWVDSRGRPLRDLRISVTDRCNFRCRYCMPKEKIDPNRSFLMPTEILSFEEIERMARIFVANGVEKIRLTGGEPLIRKHIEYLVSRLSGMTCWNGKKLDVAITTNGSALHAKAKALADNGLKRLTVSLDAMDEELFQSINDVGFPVAKVLDGIRCAQDAGISEIKVNVVVKKGLNDGEVLKIVEHFRGTGVIPRFIEYMDVGTKNGWRLDDVVASRDLVRMIDAVYPIEPVDPNYPGEVAARWRFKDGAGEIGFISSVSEPFCHECSRMRLSVDGKVYRCLFAGEGFDIRQMLRGGASDEEIEEAIGRIWTQRGDHYSEIRTEETNRERSRIEMSYIGG